MQDNWTVEDLGSHTFMVRGTEHGDQVEVQVSVGPDAVDDLGLTGSTDEQIVDATINYLLGHQRLDELPAEVDLEVVAAAYDDFADAARARLASND